MKNIDIACLLLWSASCAAAQGEPSIPEGTKKFYETGIEGKRLSKGGGRIEQARVEVLLKRFLPKPPAAVADIGGGMGVYAFPLADKGYAVSLIDPVAVHIDAAREADRNKEGGHLRACVVGDARKVPLEDSSMDVVLLFGPLYHLDHADRLLALSEAYRVLKPGGLLMAQTVSRYAVYINALFDDKLGLPEHEQMIHDSLDKGRYEYRGAVFYCHTPEETKAEIEQAKFSTVRILSVEGLGKWLKPDCWENEKTRSTLMALTEQTEEDPSLLGATSHIMAIGRK